MAGPTPAREFTRTLPHPQYHPLIAWLTYAASPFVKPPQPIIDAGLLRETERGAWVLTDTGRKVSGTKPITAQERRGG